MNQNIFLGGFDTGMFDELATNQLIKPPHFSKQLRHGQYFKDNTIGKMLWFKLPSFPFLYKRKEY